MASVWFNGSCKTTTNQTWKEATKGNDSTAALGALWVDEGKRKGHVDEVVRPSVEETLNGLLDAEADALCHLDVHDMPPRKIKSLREKAHVSQAVFAAVLNTSVSTVQTWEAGDKKRSGPSLKLLNLIERKGLEAVIWLCGRDD